MRGPESPTAAYPPVTGCKRCAQRVSTKGVSNTTQRDQLDAVHMDVTYIRIPL